MNELALFAGAGGGILAGELLGWRCVCAVECEPYPASVLAQRQNDGLLAPFPIWDDVCTFDGRPWRGRVDVVSGGFPCQDISVAGRGEGIDGERSGLWGEMARIIDEVRPRFAFVENSPALTSRGLGRVLGNLAEMGFNAEWGVLGASDVGAPHKRKRIWIAAHSAQLQRNGRDDHAGKRVERKQVPESGDSGGAQDVADTASKRHSGSWQRFYPGYQAPHREGQTGQSEHVRFGEVWKTEPDVGRVADGIPARVDRLKALGNAQVPQCAAEAFRILHGRLSE